LTAPSVFSAATIVITLTTASVTSFTSALGEDRLSGKHHNCDN
jgi:hypothetical protein